MKPIKIDESKTRIYQVYPDGTITSTSKKTDIAKQLSPVFEKNRGICVKVNKVKQSVHNIVWNSFYGEIPNDKVVKHNDGDPYNCDMYNLYLAERSNLKVMVQDQNIAVVCMHDEFGDRHFRNLEDLTVFLNRDGTRYKKSAIVNMFNSTEYYKYGDWSVYTVEYYYNGTPDDIIWDESFPSWNYDDDVCEIVNLNCSMRESDM